MPGMLDASMDDTRKRLAMNRTRKAHVISKGLGVTVGVLTLLLVLHEGRNAATTGRPHHASSNFYAASTSVAILESPPHSQPLQGQLAPVPVIFDHEVHPAYQAKNGERVCSTGDWLFLYGVLDRYQARYQFRLGNLEMVHLLAIDDKWEESILSAESEYLHAVCEITASEEGKRNYYPYSDYAVKRFDDGLVVFRLDDIAPLAMKEAEMQKVMRAERDLVKSFMSDPPAEPSLSIVDDPPLNVWLREKCEAYEYGYGIALLPHQKLALSGIIKECQLRLSEMRSEYRELVSLIADGMPRIPCGTFHCSDGDDGKYVLRYSDFRALGDLQMQIHEYRCQKWSEIEGYIASICQKGVGQSESHFRGSRDCGNSVPGGVEADFERTMPSEAKSRRGGSIANP